MASAVLKFSRVIRKGVFLSRIRLPTGKVILQRQFHQCGRHLAATDILMPSLSPTMEEGTIVKWYTNEGDKINAGDVLCDVQTDKAVVAFDTEDEGIMAKILKPENSSEVKIGTLIAIMVEEGDDWQNVEIPAETAAPSAAPTPSGIPSQPATSTVTPLAATTVDVHEDLHAHGIGPSVRKLMEEYGVHVSNLSGSGPHGRITKWDVIKHININNLQRQALPAETSAGEVTAKQTPVSDTMQPTSGYIPSLIPDIDGEEFVDIPNTSMRSTIAKRLTLSKTTIPHSYATMNCNVGPVAKLRKQLMNEDNVKVSVNDFIIKSAAFALQRVPQVNSILEADGPTALLNVDISVAVATDNGLITPIVKNTPQLAVDEISATVKDLADRARANKLQLHEFQGGSFTISNLGMFGIGEFSAVINPPQTAILAVGSSRVVLGSDGKPESQMTVTLSYDARVIDDAEASQFLEVFRDVIENPQLMMSGRPASKRSNYVNVMV